MQDLMFAVNIPSLLVLGFLIGVILLLIGYRESANMARRNHMIGLGLVVIGLMVPITPLSWYLYWLGLNFGLVEIVVTAIALVIGVTIIYMGGKTYSKT